MVADNINTNTNTNSNYKYIPLSEILEKEPEMEKLGEFGDVEIENFCEQAERENIFPLVAYSSVETHFGQRIPK